MSLALRDKALLRQGSPGKIKMAIDEASGLQVYGGLEQQDKQLHRTQSYSMDNSTQGMEDTVGKGHCV